MAEFTSIQFRKLPLGARFKYEIDSEKLYVVLSKVGSGLVAEDWPADKDSTLQGIYSAFDTISEKAIKFVWAVTG